MIKAEQVTLNRSGEDVVLEAGTVAGADLPDRMWFSLPAGRGGDVAVDGDPILPVLALIGMARHEAVEVPEVSAQLLDGCRRVMDIYDGWSSALGDSLRRVPITAPTRCRPRTGHAAGAFFSGGVDSTYTLLRNHDRYPSGDARRISCLLLGHGLDVPLDDETLFGEVLATAKSFATAHGVELIPVRTNVRAFTAGIDWGRYAHGPCLAAIGHAFSPLLHTLYIASSYWFTTLKPWGSHPDIDSRWSSERLEFVHDGLEATRSDKIRRIARSEAALATLRVCWRNRGNQFNCGRCEKCLRTMFALQCCGVLERAATFPSRLEADLVAGLRLKPAEVPYWEDNLRLAEESGVDRALTELVRRAVEKGRQPREAAPPARNSLVARALRAIRRGAR